MATRTPWLGALLCCLVASCSDATATAPTGSVTVTVSPDTIRLLFGDARIFYSRRSVNAAGVRVLAEGIEVQAEAAPGNWLTVEDPLNTNIPFALRDGETIDASGDAAGLWTARIAPGRYRLHYAYRLARADGTASGDRRTTDSNLFVVLVQ